MRVVPAANTVRIKPMPNRLLPCDAPDGDGKHVWGESYGTAFCLRCGLTPEQLVVPGRSAGNQGAGSAAAPDPAEGIRR